MKPPSRNLINPHMGKNEGKISYQNAVADLGFLRGGGANSPGGRQHTISPKFPKNCMKLKEFGLPGGARVQNFTM